MDQPTSRMSEMFIERLSDVPEWMLSALCANTDLDPFSDFEEIDFIQICNQCPVQTDCGNFAESGNVTSGVWGGKVLGK